PGQQLLHRLDRGHLLAQPFAGEIATLLRRVGHDRDARSLSGPVGVASEGGARAEADDADSEVGHGCAPLSMREHGALPILPERRVGGMLRRRAIYNRSESIYARAHPVKAPKPRGSVPLRVRSRGPTS